VVTVVHHVTVHRQGFAAPRPLAAPLDTVVFAASVLLDDDPAGARSGARRLIAGLVGQGVRVGIVDPAAGPGELAGRLGEAGFPPGLATGAVVPGSAAAEASHGRAVVVTRRAGDAGDAAPTGAPGWHTVVTGDRPVHRALLDWLTGRAGAFAAAARLCGPLDEPSVTAARHHHLRLTKPAGSLGRLEDVGALLAGIAGGDPPPRPAPAAVAVFAGDHGVHAQSVTPWPQEVTGQMVANFVAGGAAINVLARQAGAEVTVVDVGVAADLPPARGLIDRKVRRGTADLTTGPAMSTDDARRALDVGAEVAARLVDGGARCLVTGDMGIANTTPAAALIAALTDRPAAAVTGRGTGIDDDLLTRKTALVAAAAARARYAHGVAPLEVLAEVGGLEHAALAGFIVAAAALQVPVVVDGVIADSALLVASRLVPGVESCVLAGHRSAEPGATVVLATLGLEPLVDLGLRLGEGTGAALALPLVEAAARVLDEMATFDQAGVSDKG
jgi:nicotinate-nucleotide--dimethylbenzimidazole phosphoribosyltransferase